MLRGRFMAIGVVVSATLLAAIVSVTLPANSQARHRSTQIAPQMPGPARAATSKLHAADINQRCEKCHVEIAQEWRQSLHRQAHTNKSYQRALALEPMPFCRGCHAPEADPTKDPPAALGALGVGCVSCHSAGSGILAAPNSGRQSGAIGKAHGVLRTPLFSQPDACRNCHQFNFPGRRQTPLAMQSTADEHQRSPFAQRSCASCHMPVVGNSSKGSHRSHAFAASRDEAKLRAAVQVRAARINAREVAIQVTPRGIGHAFPTGDLFRRLEIAAEAVGPEANVVSSKVQYLARHFRKQRRAGGGSMTVLARDDRLHGKTKTVRLMLDADAAAFPIHWRVVYQRVAHPLDSNRTEVEVDGETLLASGVLPIRQ